MNNATILVVEDNLVNQQLIKHLIRKAGYDVQAVTDAEEAMSVLETFCPALIIMDIQLPGMDGLTLTRLLKKEPATCDIPVVALTAYAMPGDEQKALDAGCDAYITKPIDTRAFPHIIAHHLAQYSQTDQREAAATDSLPTSL